MKESCCVEAWLQATKNDPRRTRVVDAVPTTTGYLRQIASANRKGRYIGSTDFHKNLHAASQKHTPDLVMTLEKLRPDVWGSEAS